MDLFKELTSSTSRQEPDVWISRVVLYERLSPEPVEIRAVNLSRGLNIIWAEEIEEDHPAAEITGHSAGKTTFCRLLRYVLGEKTFGTKSNMDLIHRSLTHGYVAAELRVLGRQWAVRRPLGSGRLSYIMENATIEQLLQEHGRSVSQENYTKEVGFECLVDRLETGGITRTGELIQWGHLLAWCTRDQEARFQNIHEWRSPRSESEAPSFRFSKVGPLFVMRAVLGLFLPSELSGEENLTEFQRQQDKLEKEIEEKKREPQFRIGLYEQELRRQLGEVLPGISDLADRPFRSDKLFPESLERLTDNAAKQLVADIEKLEQEESGQQEMLENLGVSIKQHEKEVEQFQALFSLHDGATEEIVSGLSQGMEQQQKLRENLNKMCPLGDVLVRDCGHVKNRQGRLQLSEIHDNRALAKAKELQDQERLKVKKEVERLKANVRQLSLKKQEVTAQRDSRKKERQKKEEELRNLQRIYHDLEFWIEQRDRPGGYEHIEHLQQELNGINQRIVETENELTNLLAQHSKNRDLLTTIFSAAVRSVLLSGTYDGEVKFTNRELEFRITRGQAMSGEAVETLAVLLADISCILYNSMAETARLPGFLLHDSPREADLGKRLYYSFIRFVAAIQRHFGSPDNCPFQYVLTTTTAPPEELKSSDHVKLLLNAAKTQELLFRRNFAEPQQQQRLLWDRHPHMVKLQ